MEFNVSLKVLISSSDEADLKKLCDLLHAREYEVIIDKPGSDTIYDILNNDIYFIICDVSDEDTEIFTIINIIKQLRPTVPVISIIEFSAIGNMRKLYEMGIFYNAMKPVQTGEIDSIIDALETVCKKN